MQAKNKGLDLLMQYFSLELNSQFDSSQFELKNQLLIIIENYLNNKVSHDELLHEFIQLNISTNLFDKIRKIKQVIDNPFQFDINNISNDSTNYCQKKKKSWTLIEDIRLLGGIGRFGTENWGNISKVVGNGRTSAMCSQRWRRALSPYISKEPWSNDEDILLLKYIQQSDCISWSNISSLMKTRSDLQCKYRFQQINKHLSKNTLLYDIDRSDDFFNNKLEQAQLVISANMSQSTSENFIYADECNHKYFQLPQIKMTETDSNLHNEINILKSENYDLKNKNMLLNMNKSFLQKKVIDIRKKNDLIVHNKNMQISNLQRIIEKLKKSKNEGSNENVIGPMDLTETVISNLIKNSHIKPSGRRYTQTIYDLSFALYIHSNITYKILRTFLPLPSEPMLRERFGSKFKESQNNLLDSKQIKLILDEFKNEFNDGKIYATIAYDSATVDPVDTNKSNLFVFNVQPLDYTKKSIICHITQNESGKTDDSIKKIIKQIVAAGEESGICFLFMATDGETGTNKIHTDFNKFVQGLNASCFDEIVDKISTFPELIPISDWLHIIKDLRTRFATNNISMFPGAPIFNGKQINEILKLDEIVITASGPTAMRDDLALILFCSQNLEILAEHNEFCPFVFLLPFTLVTIAIQSYILTTDARYQLIKIAFNVIAVLRQQAQGLRSKRSKKSPIIDVRFALEATCKRTMNTIIALGYAMKHFNENLSISRLFTHTIEFIFGYMRRLTYGNDRSNVAINALTKQQISNKIFKKYNLDQIHVRGRIAVVDEKIEDLTSDWKTELCQLDENLIADEIILLMKGQLIYEKTETYKLLNFIKFNTPSFIPSLNSNKRKGDSIFSRQVAYHKK